ncbi:MAG: hypothetical protein V2A62_00360, partial [Candidatus Woesearchaeota archaeon]
MRKAFCSGIFFLLAFSLMALAVNTESADDKWNAFIFSEKNDQNVFGTDDCSQIKTMCTDFSSVTAIKKCLTEGTKMNSENKQFPDSYFDSTGVNLNDNDPQKYNNLGKNTDTTYVLVTWIYYDGNPNPVDYRIKWLHDDDLAIFSGKCGSSLSSCTLSGAGNHNGDARNDYDIPLTVGWNVVIAIVDNGGGYSHALWYVNPGQMFSKQKNAGYYMFSNPIKGDSPSVSTTSYYLAPGSTDGEPYDNNDCQDVSTEENPLVKLVTYEWKDKKVDIQNLNNWCCPSTKFCAENYCYAPGSIVYDKMNWYCAGNYKTKSNIWVFCDANTKNEVTEDGSYVCDGSQWTTCTGETIYGDYVCKDGMLVSLTEPEACYVSSAWSNPVCHNPPQPCSETAGEEDRVVVWSYDSWEEDLFAAKTPPVSQYSCCKPNECVNTARECKSYDSYYKDKYICGLDNNWDTCNSTTNVNTPSDGGKYYCDGQKWIKNENCTDPKQDVNQNGLVGCQDPSCKDQIGAYFNSKILDPTSYKEDKPTCLNKKDGCKCEFGKETKCDDGFDNDDNVSTAENYVKWKGCIDQVNKDYDVCQNNCDKSGKTLCGCLFLEILGGLNCKEKYHYEPDCFDPNCLGEKGPGGAKCCNSDASGATCGKDLELHETSCGESGQLGLTGDEDGDKLSNCQDPDCNDQLCGGATDRERWRCSNQVCTPPPTAGPAPVIKIMNITFFTYGDLLQF